MRIGWDVSERAYIVLVYGWDKAHKQGLHVTRSKPVFVISNGDRADNATTFLFDLAGTILGFTFLFASLGLVARLTALLGRRVHVFTAAMVLSNSQKPEPNTRAKPADVIFVVATFGLSIATIHLVVGNTLLHTLRNHVVFLAAASVVLRLAFIGSPRISNPPGHAVRERRRRP